MRISTRHLFAILAIVVLALLFADTWRLLSADDTAPKTPPATAAQAKWYPDDDEPVQVRETPPVVVLGVSGLTAADLSRIGDYPALAKRAGAGAIANQVARGTDQLACPLDGWLSLQTSQRVSAIEDRDGSCPSLAAAARTGVNPTRLSAPTTVTYGLLGRVLTDFGISTHAIGEGARVALGTPARPAQGDAAPASDAALATAVARSSQRSRVTIVDADVDRPALALAPRGSQATDSWEGVVAPEASDPDRSARLLARLNTVVAGLDDDTQVIVTSLADAHTTSRLQAAIISTSDVTTGLARSSSTRTSGLVTTADLTQLIIRSAGLRETPRGQGMTIAGGGQASLTLTLAEGGTPRAQAELAERIAILSDRALHARVTLSVQPVFMGVLALGGAACLVGLLVVLRRDGRTRTGGRPAREGALLLACVPAATFVANLVPTWRLATSMPIASGLALLGVTVAIAAAAWVVAHACGAAARALSPDQPMTRWVPLIAVCAMTFAALIWAAGSRQLTLDAVMGSSTLLGARYYGIGNCHFALLMVATLAGGGLTAAIGARSGWTLAGQLVAAGAGAWAIAVNGAAGLGADVGGPFALTPGVLVLLVLLMRGRWRGGDAAAIAALSVGVLVHFMLRDFARPPLARSQAGAFVQAVVDGRGAAILATKARAMAATFLGSGLGIAATGVGLVLLALCVRQLRALHRRLGTSTGEGAQVPGLVAVASAILVSTVVGMLVNDSGVIVAGTVVLLGAPLLLAALLTAAADTPAHAAHLPGRALAVAALAIVGVGAVGGTLLGPSPTPAGSTIAKVATRPTVVVYTHSLDWQRLDYLARERDGARLGSGWMFNLIPLRTSQGSCPLDAFLATNAVSPVSRQSLGGADLCIDLPVVPKGHTLPGWEYFRAAEKADSHTQRLGSLGDALARANISAHAIGGDAAAVFATSNGRVAATTSPIPRTDAALASAVADSAAHNRITVVDAEASSVNDDLDRIDAARRRMMRDIANARGIDDLSELDPNVVTRVRARLNPIPEASGTPIGDLVRAYPTILPTREVGGERVAGQHQRLSAEASVRQLRRVEAIVKALAPTTQVLIVSTTNATQERTMGAGVLLTGSNTPALGHTGSVLQPGMAQVADIGATIARASGLDSSDLTAPAGAPLTAVSVGSSAEARWNKILDDAQRARAIGSARSAFHTPVRTAAVALFLLVAVVSVRPLWRRLHPEVPGGSLTLVTGARVACLTLAAQPLASILVSLTPWWRSPTPAHLIGVSTWVIGALLALAVMVACRRVAGPMVTIAGATALLLLLDIARGSRVLIDSPLGFNSLAGARFYGAGNEAYTLAATGFFFSVGVGAAALIHAGRRVSGLTLFIGGGLIVAAIDGAPSMGADFGGPISLLPGLAVSAILLSGARLSWRKLLLACVGTGIVGIGVAVADWMRPPAQRTHLGRFVESALSGDLMPILVRKLGANLSALTWSGHRWVVLAALVLAVGFLAFGMSESAPRPSRGRSWWGRIDAARHDAWGWLAPASYADSVPAAVAGIRPVLAGWIVTEFFGFALNDSGILLPGLAAILGVPLLVDAVLQTRSRRR